MSDGIYETLPETAVKNVKDFEATVSELKAAAIQGKKEDDCSALCLKIGQVEPLPRCYEFNKADHVDEQLERISKIFYSLAGDQASRLELLLGEALSNAARHGESIRVKINKIGLRLIVRVKDDGPGFNGNDLVRQYRAARLEEEFSKIREKPCGRGILIMMAWTDQVLYSRRGNEVMLVKNLGPVVKA